MDIWLFVLFGLMLLGIGFLHRQAIYISVIGSLLILVFKEIADPSFHLFRHLLGETNLVSQFSNPELREGHWLGLLNLFGLLTGFSVLAYLFEESGVPAYIPKLLPKGWRGPFCLLLVVFLLSSFLDNIAAAMIGGAVALVVFNRKVHVGYVAAIVGASNAGGAWSVVGDTTTTMMWMQGVQIGSISHAFIASLSALSFFGLVASRQQHHLQPVMQAGFLKGGSIQWVKLGIVVAILLGAVVANLIFSLPAIGVWAAIIAGRTLSQIPLSAVWQSLLETFILLALVFAASLMPVYDLPPASIEAAFGIGIVSAFFNNIPLTEMCLEEGGFDWGILAYTIGFGGSMLWFGSSAGVAITSQFNEARDMSKWLKGGWHIMVAYVLGFLALTLTLGWHPTAVR